MDAGRPDGSGGPGRGQYNPGRGWPQQSNPFQGQSPVWQGQGSSPIGQEPAFGGAQGTTPEQQQMQMQMLQMQMQMQILKLQNENLRLQQNSSEATNIPNTGYNYAQQTPGTPPGGQTPSPWGSSSPQHQRASSFTEKPQSWREWASEKIFGSPKASAHSPQQSFIPHGYGQPEGQYSIPQPQVGFFPAHTGHHQVTQPPHEQLQYQGLPIQSHDDRSAFTNHQHQHTQPPYETFGADSGHPSAQQPITKNNEDIADILRLLKDGEMPPDLAKQMLEELGYSNISSSAEGTVDPQLAEEMQGVANHISNTIYKMSERDENAIKRRMDTYINAVKKPVADNPALKETRKLIQPFYRKNNKLNEEDEQDLIGFTSYIIEQLGLQESLRQLGKYVQQYPDSTPVTQTCDIISNFINDRHSKANQLEAHISHNY